MEQFKKWPSNLNIWAQSKRFGWLKLDFQSRYWPKLWLNSRCKLKWCLGSAWGGEQVEILHRTFFLALLFGQYRCNSWLYPCETNIGTKLSTFTFIWTTTTFFFHKDGREYKTRLWSMERQNCIQNPLKNDRVQHWRTFYFETVFLSSRMCQSQRHLLSSWNDGIMNF